MKKYAEVGISRLAAAVPSKLSNEELSDYTKLICELCDRAQVMSRKYCLRLLGAEVCTSII